MTVAIELLEHTGYTVWSPDQHVEIGGWTVRSNGGFTRRANSATTIGTAETSIDTKRAIEGWLDERGAPLTVRVTPLIDEATVARCVAAWQLSALDETIVLARLPVRSIGGREVLVVDAGDEEFTRELMDLNDRNDSDLEPWSRLVERISHSAAGLWIPGRAAAFVAVDHGVACLFSLAVDDEFRRGGIATKVMNSAFTWAASRNAETLFLQVLATNTPALGLYERLGFQEVYRYHYLQPSTGGFDRS